MKNLFIPKIKKVVLSFFIMVMLFVQPINIFPDGSALNPVITAEAAVVRLNKTKLTLNIGETYTLKLSGNKKKVTWSSSKKAVAAVNSKGVVKARKNGSTVITAKIGKKKYSCRITVKSASKKMVSYVKLNYKSVGLKKKETVTLKAAVGPSTAVNRKVKWTSSNKKIATVNQKGVVQAVSNGTCTITAAAVDGSKKKASCNIIVGFSDYVTVEGVTFDMSRFPNSILLDKGISFGDDLELPKPEYLYVRRKGREEGDEKVTYKINNGNAPLVYTDKSPNLYPSLAEKIESVYYASDWKNRMATVEIRKKESSIMGKYVEITPAIKKGSFSVSAYYKNHLIRTCTVTIDYVNKKDLEFRKWVNDVEKNAWTSDMTNVEKLHAIETYIQKNYSYVTDGIWCNQGARALLYAANDLGLQARYRYVGLAPGPYDYWVQNRDWYDEGCHASMNGHVCTVVTIDGKDYFFETNGHYY